MKKYSNIKVYDAVSNRNIDENEVFSMQNAGRYKIWADDRNKGLKEEKQNG
ncbi:MAG: hypothetical protein QME45_07930 [Clostridiales bacterium]|nr:hypothetical protein [Clostridiales bacterium]